MSENIFPVVSCDARLGEQFTEVYCNPRYLTACARELGMSDEQITDLNVYFSADAPGDDLAETHTLGEYHHEERTLKVYLGDKVASHNEVKKVLKEDEDFKHLSAKDRKRIAKNIAEKEQVAANNTLLHELRHAADYALLPDAAAQEERASHFDNTRGKRERYQKYFGTLGTVGAVGMTAGMLDMLTVTTDGGSARSLSIIMGSSILSIVGFTLSDSNHKKNYSFKQSHNDYLNRPWEVRARTYGNQGAEAAYSASPPLTRFKLK